MFGAGDWTSGTQDPFSFSLSHWVTQASHSYCLCLDYFSLFFFLWNRSHKRNIHFPGTYRMASSAVLGALHSNFINSRSNLCGRSCYFHLQLQRKKVRELASKWWSGDSNPGQAGSKRVECALIHKLSVSCLIGWRALGP